LARAKCGLEWELSPIPMKMDEGTPKHVLSLLGGITRFASGSVGGTEVVQGDGLGWAAALKG